MIRQGEDWQPQMGFGAWRETVRSDGTDETKCQASLLRGNATVGVVKSFENRRCHESRMPWSARERGVAWQGRFAGQSLMRPFGVVIVVDELAEEPFKMAFAQWDDMIEKLPAERPDESLDERVLPGTVRSRRDWPAPVSNSPCAN